MKKDTVVNDFLAKYTLKQLWEVEELTEKSNRVRSHFCHKQRLRKMRREKTGN